MPAKNDRITPQTFRNRIIDRNGRVGMAACEIMAAAIDVVNPYDCTKDYLKIIGCEAELGDHIVNLNSFDRILLIGFGKASVPMAKAVIDVFGERISKAMVITKDDRFLDENGYQGLLEIYLGGHPIPSEASITATQSIIGNLPTLTKNDLILMVISGGASALFTDPIMGLSLNDLQTMTSILLKSGANIEEINTIRKHLDGVKGGRLAQHLQPAHIHTFILSDVIGDRLDMIASGPTFQDSTTFKDALEIVNRYGIKQRIPQTIFKIIEKGCRGEYPETPKPGEFPMDRVHNHLVGTNIKAGLAAAQKAEELGFQSAIITSHLSGLTKEISEFLAGIIKTELAYDLPLKKPACLIFGGETTVVVTGDGLGGRNQDLVLRMVPKLAGKKGVLFISLATDGEDGPTDAAGAAADSAVYLDGSSKLDMNIDTYIDTNNSYYFFEKLGGLIKTGSTGTNVNDLVIILMDHTVD